MVGTLRIEDLVGEKRSFFSEYFHRRPLLRVGAVADRLDEFLSSAQLRHDVVATVGFTSDHLRLVKEGKDVARGSFTLPVGRTEMLIPAEVDAQLGAGATLICRHVDRFLPSMRRLADGIVRSFACQSEVIAFLTPAETHALAPHSDADDVIVVHLEGMKDWKVWDTPTTDSDSRSAYDLAELGTPLLDVTLRPGDILYLPAQAPHFAAAPQRTSLHVSVTIEQRRCEVTPAMA